MTNKLSQEQSLLFEEFFELLEKKGDGSISTQVILPLFRK